MRAEWRALSTAAVLRATMYKCFDYDLRNEEVTVSRVCGISVPTKRQNWPSRLCLSLDLLREELSGGSDSRVCLQCGRPASIPGSGRSPGEGNGNFLPGKSHGWRSMADYSPWGCKQMHFFTIRGLVLFLNLSKISMTATTAYYVCVCVCACTLSCLNLLWPHLAHQASLSMEIFWQYWSGLTFSSPRDLPDSGIKSTSPVVPALIGDSLTLSHQGSPDILLIVQN